MFNVRRFWYRLRKYKVTEEEEGNAINLQEGSGSYSKIKTPGSDVIDERTLQTFKVGTLSFICNECIYF